MYAIIHVFQISYSQNTPATFVIDSIKIEKNWLTKDKIILQELMFSVGDTVSMEEIVQSESRILNVGNFSEVKLSVDSSNHNLNILCITASDSWMVSPVLIFQGNIKDKNLIFGVNDNNFLGYNVRIYLYHSFGDITRQFGVGVSIPRQLLYKNMSVAVNSTFGEGYYYKYDDRKLVSALACERQNFTIRLTNPYHKDFEYKFSPDINLSLFDHKVDSLVFDNSIRNSLYYHAKYLQISLIESVGFIRRERYRRDGYSFNVSLTCGIGLNSSNPFYYGLGVSFVKYFQINKVLQPSFAFSTGYVSVPYPSMQYQLSATDFKGLYTGEISGKSFYSTYLGLHATYINTNWLVLEQSAFINIGVGGNSISSLVSNSPFCSIGTGFLIGIPKLSYGKVVISMSWSGPDGNWFNLNY